MLPLNYGFTTFSPLYILGTQFLTFNAISPEVQCKIEYSKVPSNSQLIQIYLIVLEKNPYSKPQWVVLRDCDVCATDFIVICMYYSVSDKKHMSLVYKMASNLGVSFLFHRPIKRT